MTTAYSKKCEFLVVLVEARKLLQKNKSYVCSCIEEVGQINAMQDISQDLIEQIREAIDYSCIVEVWLEKQGIPLEEIMDSTTLEQRHEYRLRWLDSMIENMKENGTIYYER